MLTPFSFRRPRAGVAALLLCAVFPRPGGARQPPDPAAPLVRAMAEAEAGLRESETQIAESRYRTALLEGWLLSGGIEVAEGDLEAARAAFESASTAAVEAHQALISLALVHLELEEAQSAVRVLRSALAQDPRSLEARRLLAQALIAAGQASEAVQELEEARALAPDDPELAFALAGGYLRVGRMEEAERLFAVVAEQRPIPQTYVLIGRTYRDSGHYQLARAALETALEMDPRVPRAHYYLGTLELFTEGQFRLDQAIARFEQELELAPVDPMTRLYLGMALAEGRRYEEALPALEIASGSEPTRLNALRYLGRCYLGLARLPEAVAALGEALELAEASGAEARNLSTIHYLLAQALRRQGEADRAAPHFAAAERYAADSSTGDRQSISRFLNDELDRERAREAPTPSIENPAVTALDPAQRVELRRRVETALARAYLNLGVLHARTGRFARAAGLFEQAAEIDPDFSDVQRSLGMAYFNTEQFEKAAQPLSRALERRPDDAELKRMLALAWVNTEAYGRAAELLADDPERASNPSLAYVYGMALVRSNRAAEAQPIFERLLAEHGDWPELSVLLGQAHAQQGDYEAAIRSLRRALELDPAVADAHATLGVLYLRQGKLAESEEALRAELASHPDDLRSRYHLATVLDLSGEQEAALEQLRSVLEVKPDFADARYLLGKVLLAQGAAEEAAAQLEAAAALAPEDANIHYQLGHAYQKLGQSELARQQFDLFQELKQRQRRGEP